ncbi:MarC family protein [uncultured Cyclobacterium sp.]|uniref:MarC family protein n=1 Tax=uncultured Cyclobacterium sp. TaxID=453820 RepID=UPI0030ED1C34|tara:strand:- start:165366 stop:166037 length:672 start_codon:yes stop_codon:yes gene_type:complete
MDWNLNLNFLAAMLAMVNPIGLIPIWYDMTGDATPKVRRKIALMVTGTSFFTLLIFLLLGEYILVFFNIDIEVFKIAGGFLLMFTALSMINGSATKLEEIKEEADTNFELAKLRFEKVLVPLVIPILAGPGSITTVLLYSFRATGSATYTGLSGVLLVSYFFLFIVFSFSYKIENKVDDIVFVGFTRLFGLIVAAIAVQFMVEGLGEVFPNWMEGGSAVKSKD